MLGYCILKAFANASLSYLLPAELMIEAWSDFSKPENFRSKWA